MTSNSNDKTQERIRDDQSKARSALGLKGFNETKVRYCNHCASKFPSYREERICNVCKKSETFRSGTIQGHLIEEDK